MNTAALERLDSQTLGTLPDMLAGVPQGLAQASRVGESGNAQRCVGLRRILVWFGASGDRERKEEREAVAVVARAPAARAAAAAAGLLLLWPAAFAFAHLLPPSPSLPCNMDGFRLDSSSGSR